MLFPAPMMVEPASSLIALCALAGLAGFVDAVVGGGGLIQLPALFVLMPHLAPVILLGTNKFASVWGTGAAAWHYTRSVRIEWQATLPTMAAALLASFAGAHTAALISRDAFRPLVLVLLLAVLAYTLRQRTLGTQHAPRLDARASLLLALAGGGAIGFYDGFLGPGTGSFLIFMFVGLFGFSFLAASASAKLVNVITNIAALAYFITQDQVRYDLAVPMAICNVAGSLIGTRLAIRRGNGFVRLLFVIVVSALIARYGWDIAQRP